MFVFFGMNEPILLYLIESGFWFHKKYQVWLSGYVFEVGRTYVLIFCLAIDVKNISLNGISI